QPGLDDDGLLHAGHAVGDHHRDPAGVPGDLEGTGDQRVEPDVRDQAVPDLVDDLVDRRGQQVPVADGGGDVLAVGQAVTVRVQQPVQVGIWRAKARKELFGPAPERTRTVDQGVFQVEE